MLGVTHGVVVTLSLKLLQQVRHGIAHNNAPSDRRLRQVAITEPIEFGVNGCATLFATMLVESMRKLEVDSSLLQVCA
jgi:hypothetical protein